MNCKIDILEQESEEFLRLSKNCIVPGSDFQVTNVFKLFKTYEHDQFSNILFFNYYFEYISYF